jgi:hypothetical protein
MCEEFDSHSFKGRIVSIELTSEGFASQPNVVIDLPYHTSYPYVVQDGEIFYCVPETAQAREIALFECADFPRSWKKVATLVNGFDGRDNTVFKHGELWWLSSCAGDNRNLFLWYSSKLSGEWRPHQGNPVKNDICSSRPAGTPFVYKSSLYRPAQDCSRTYGGRIIINRVMTLTPSEFEEVPSGIIEPDQNGPYPDGAHTVSNAGNFTLLDGKRTTFARKAIKSILRRP